MIYLPAIVVFFRARRRTARAGGLDLAPELWRLVTPEAVGWVATALGTFAGLTAVCHAYFGEVSRHTEVNI